MKPLLFFLILLFPFPAYAVTFTTESMKIPELVRKVANIYNDDVVYNSKQTASVAFQITEEENRKDVYLKLALLLVEYGIELEEEGERLIFKDFDNAVPQINHSGGYNDALKTSFKYKVKHSASSAFAEGLQSLFIEGQEYISDTTINNTVIITAFTQRLEEVQQLLEDLDQPDADFLPLKHRVFNINYLSRETVESLVLTAFGKDIVPTFNDTGTKLYLKLDDKDMTGFSGVLAKFDKPKKQILLDVIVSEMTLGKAKELGMQLAYNGGSNRSAISYPTLNSVLGSGISALSTGLVLSFAVDKFAFVLENMQTDARTNILSTPSLMTKEGYEASLVVGQSVPFKTGEYTGADGSGSPDQPFVTIERHDVGIKLTFTPRILPNGVIDLVLAQELSSVARSSTGASDIITNKRELKTNVIVANNDIIVLGGLVESAKSYTKDSSPILSKIPLLGRLFQNTKQDDSSTNLMIFIRPRILTANSKHNRALIAQYINQPSKVVQVKKPKQKKPEKQEDTQEELFEQDF